MKCDNDNNEATVTYTQDINGNKTTYHLCEDCAQKMGIGFGNTNSIFSNTFFDDDFFNMDTNKFISKMFENFSNTNLKQLLGGEKQEKRCEECGYTFEDILNEGKLRMF